jgi:hypothetical protein
VLEVTFVIEPAYRETIEEIDATFVPFYNYANFAEVDILTRWPLRETFLKGPLKPAFDLEEVFIKTIPSQLKAAQIALKALNGYHPSRPIIVLN